MMLSLATNMFRRVQMKERETWNTFMSVPLYPPQIPHETVWDENR
jgi:hypothetical protein